MQLDYSTANTDLELRVLELEDTVGALVGVVKTMTELLGHLNQIVGHYADTLASVSQALPTLARKSLPMWPTVATAAGCTCGSAGAATCCRPTDPA